MKLIIAGGGTGGHVIPGLAIAESFSKKYGKDNVLFIGTLKGLEAKLVPQNHFNIKYVTISGIKRKKLFEILKSLIRIPLSIIQAALIIISFKPQVIIGVGGYASFPAIIAGFILRKKLAIQEQNSIPGITNRILSFFVNNIFYHFDTALKYFPTKKAIKSGNPILEKFISNIKTSQNINKEKLTIAIIGGSQGAKILNKIIPQAIEQLQELKEKINLIHQTGPLEFENIIKVYENINFKADVRPFISNMSEIYNNADLLICRAGAMTITELTLAGKASILIPFQYATDNHQEINALTLSQNGAAIMITEKELSPIKLANTISELIKYPERRKLMSEKALKLGIINSNRTIIEAIESLCS